MHGTQHNLGRLRALAGPLAALCTLLATSPVAAGRDVGAPPQSAMIIDANTGKVLLNQSADEPRHPASLTKMMTLYMVFELIEAGRLSYSTKIAVSEEAANAAPSKLELKPGEEIVLIDAIKALITKSANDVAVAIAEHIGGTEANFARLMTAKARQIGMERTTFRNASGLPNPEQVTTARDMLTLALRLQDDFPQHYPLFATRTFTYGGETYKNHNKLLFSFEGTDGIKTGYTRDSGFNLVSSVHRGGKHVVGAIFGSRSAGVRNASMRLMINRTLAAASPEKTRRPALLARPAPAKRPPPSLSGRSLALPQRPQSAGVATLAAANPVPAPPDVSAVEVARVRQVRLVPGNTGAAAQDNVGRPAAPAIARAPTTLQAQAEAINGNAGTLRSQSLPGPVTAAAARALPANGASARAVKASGDFQIQIGAFSSAAEAERHLDAARARAAQTVLGRPTVTQVVKVGNRQLYRARFSGFDARTAAAACVDLRRQQIDCLALRAE